jgi:hypothetical protein
MLLIACTRWMLVIKDKTWIDYHLFALSGAKPPKEPGWIKLKNDKHPHTKNRPRLTGYTLTVDAS